MFSELLRDRSFAGLFVFSEKNGNTGAHFQYPMRSDFFTLVLVEKGTFHVRVNLKDHELRRNQLAFAAPTALKQLVRHSPGCVYTGIIFTPEYLARIGIHKERLEALHFFASGRTPVLQLEPQEAEHLRSLLWQVKEKSKPETQQHHPFAAEVLQHTFLLFLFELGAIARKGSVLTRPRLDRKEELTVKFAKLVTEHFREKRKVHEYAEMLYLSPKYLSEAVQAFTGKTAGELIDEVVAQEARFLLLNPSLRIAEIAAMLNFPDQSHFGKFFKRKTGLSPKAFRKSRTA